MCIVAQIHESLLKRLRPEIGSGLPLFTNCREEFFSETGLPAYQSLETMALS